MFESKESGGGVRVLKSFIRGLSYLLGARSARLRLRAVALSFAALGCLTLQEPAAAQDAGADNVKIGLIVPLSGPWSRAGEIMRIGAQMAVDDVNAQGGVKALGGAKIELVVFDTGDSVERAKNAAQRMIASEPDLIGATGAYLSSFTLAISEVTERAELPLLTLSYSDLITGRDFRYIFQTSPTGDQQAKESLPLLSEVAASAGVERLQRVGIVMDNTAASVAFVKPIKDGGVLDKLDLDLVVDETFTPPLANATPLIQRVRARRPDLLLLLPTAVPDAKLLVEKMNEFGLGRGRVPVVSNGTAMGDPDLARNMSPVLLEGVMSTVANWGGKGTEDLSRRFVEKSGEPWLTQNPLSAYGHVWVLKEALEAAGSRDRKAVAAALHSIDLTDGPARFFPGGRIKFDEKGRRVGAKLLVIQWQESVPKTVYPPEAAVAKPIWPK